MNQFIKKLKEQLEQEKIRAEEQLSKFAEKDSNLKGDWDTKFPDVGAESGDDDIEEDIAQKRQEYERLLPVEFALETKLQNIEIALKKIRDNEYGICEKCGKKISEQRLLAIPETRLCMDCENKNT